MGENFQVIYCDPPWSYDNASLNRGGALRYYQTMPIEQIAALPVGDLAAKDCALFMWVTFPQIFESRVLFDAWGFEYKTCAFVWIKTNKRMNVDQASFFPIDSFDSFWGMGRWTRSNAEICLLGVRGKPKRESAAIHQIIYAPISEHSRKPAETRDKIIELCGDVPRVELFAREASEGWSIWGNEVESTINLNQNAKDSSTTSQTTLGYASAERSTGVNG